MAENQKSLMLWKELADVCELYLSIEPVGSCSLIRHICNSEWANTTEDVAIVRTECKQRIEEILHELHRL